MLPLELLHAQTQTIQLSCEPIVPIILILKGKIKQ